MIIMIRIYLLVAKEIYLILKHIKRFSGLAFTNPGGHISIFFNLTIFCFHNDSFSCLGILLILKRIPKQE